MSDHDVAAQLRRAEQLLTDFETRATEVVPFDARAALGGLDEARELADAVLAEVEQGCGEWFTARLIRVWVYRNRHLAGGDVRDLDGAVAELRQLVVHDDEVELRTDLANLLLQQYNAAPADDARHLVEAVAVLRELTAGALTDPERGVVDSLLGLALVERFRCERRHGTATAGRLDEAQRVLDRALRHLGLDDPQRAEVLLEQARVHWFRASVDEPGFTADARAEQDEAIRMFRSLASADDRAALDLAEALAWRYDETADRDDRDEAIGLFRRLGTASSALVGELLLDRAKEHPAEVDDVVAYLESAVAGRSAVDGQVHTLLFEAYALRARPGAADVPKMLGLVDAMLAADPTAVPDRPTLLALRAFASAERALATRSPDAVPAAVAELRRAARHVVPFDWTHLALLGLLGVLAVTGRTPGATSAWSPLALLRDFPPRLRSELLDWLRQQHAHRRDADVASAIALLWADRSGDDPAVPAVERERGLRGAIAAVDEARALLPEGDPLDVVLHQQSGYLRSELGQLHDEPELLGRAVAELDAVIGRMGDGHPLFLTTLALFAAAVIAACTRGGGHADSPVHARAALVRVVDEEDLDRVVKAVLLQALGFIEVMVWVEDRRAGGMTAAVRHCRRALSLLTPDDPQHDDVRFTLAIMLVDRFSVVGDHHDLDAAIAHLRALLERVRVRGPGRQVTEAGVLDLLRRARGAGRAASSTGDEVADAEAALGAVLARAGTGAPADHLEIAYQHNAYAQALIRHAQTTSDPLLITRAAEQFDRCVRLTRPGSALWARMQSGAGFTLALAGAMGNAWPVFEDGLTRLEQVSGTGGVPDGERASATLAIASSWLAWHVAGGQDFALDRALDRLAELPGDWGLHVEAAPHLDQFADACWQRGRAGDVDRAIAIGFESLRSRSRTVLLQQVDEHGMRNAADAAGRSVVVAMRCLAAGRPEQAVQAVEAGRGLVLGGTGVTADVATRLVRAGHGDLAAQWRHAASVETPPPAGIDMAMDFAPSDLRFQVLTALAGQGDLLAPPAALAIAGALRAMESDALVYLLPGRDGHRGCALLVMADGAVRELPLPALVESARPAADLEPLCEWAWDAAIGPLLHHLGPAARPVLVPIGMLGDVPWHAAREGQRLAVREAVFSYAASARQFCDLAGRRRRPLGEAPVVLLADPDVDLRSAVFEAEFLHRCYPDGRFYGTEVDGVPFTGVGTSEEVLNAIPTASVAHVGCHARSGATPEQSFLRLADGEALSVDRVLRRARARPSAALGGLVVLAACRSDVTEVVHDEALTLANAFVEAGATGVVGTRWEVDDLATSLITCVLHAELRRGTRPRDALRAAQLWALDPWRSPIEGMPPYQAGRVRAVDLTRPEYWAAFTHHGW
ncbi:hypothetical protein FHS29_006196 [Saccharothrix tamanrassetensis]|uniref:CHAT domain-containing protein n=1 Tax=Saccharothrix tamanrassetensis TaxID=1051531 RepID=A0A841CUF4_9PSEU|nr:CHAT domain-containing protein [Saccharothrix tamanrassetensis]MBB5959575.1 hypothetical protein [Saccharothrix tamanrassetensis]